MLLSLSDAQTLAALLKSANANLEIAFFAHENKVYFSRHGRCSLYEPQSSITVLIQGVYQRYPDIARLLLRNRIYSTAIPTEMCLGMVKVAAKRLTAPLIPLHQGPLSSFNLEEIVFNQDVDLPPIDTQPEVRTNHDFIKLALTMIQGIARPEHLYDSDRLVASILVSPAGEVLSWACNRNSKNRTLHSEVLLVQNYYTVNRIPIPAGSRIFVTLKPCKMCAGMIWVSAQDPKAIRVYYAQFDAGPMAKSTVLDPDLCILLVNGN